MLFLGYAFVRWPVVVTLVVKKLKIMSTQFSDVLLYISCSWHSLITVESTIGHRHTALESSISTPLTDILISNVISVQIV